MNQPEHAVLPQPGAPRPPCRHSESGVSILAVVAILGVVFALVQGTVMYRNKSSARFQAVEMHKILAQQAAEAGIEENIADLGTRKLVPLAGMSEYATYTGKGVGAGAFSTYLTTLGMGPDGDTLELHSVGKVASASQGVHARLRLKVIMDSVMNVTVKLDSSIIPVNRVIQDTTIDTVTVVQDPYAMPALNTTPAYQACMSSSDKKCDVCHIPGGNPANRHVININKNAIHTHISHHGDYVTTDGTCDIYNPRQETTMSIASSTVTVDSVAYVTTPDTVYAVNERAKVKILSWR